MIQPDLFAELDSTEAQARDNAMARAAESAGETWMSKALQAVSDLADAMEKHGWDLSELDAPAEPVDAQLFAITQERDASMAAHHLTMKEFSALTTERDRLREALEQIVNPVGMVGGNLQDIARAALDVQERT